MSPQESMRKELERFRMKILYPYMEGSDMKTEESKSDYRRERRQHELAVVDGAREQAKKAAPEMDYDNLGEI